MEEIPELPLDLVYYILLSIPVKTLRRFQCVSKLWCSLISHPRFQREHYRRSQQSPLLLLTSGYSHDPFVHFTTYNINRGSFISKFSTNEIPEFPWPVEENHVRFKVIQSCLELVCVKLFFDQSIRLCNPSTQEMIVLPAHPKEHYNICFGFGYAASTEEYKVVRFFSLEPYYEENYCEVFTLGTNDGWREARSPPPYQPRYDAHLPFLHGALHLLPDLQEQEDHYIAAFDVDTEEYRGLPFPEIYFRQGASEMRSEFIQLAELGGTLCLTFAFTSLKKMLELWFLKDYHSGIWVKQYNIDLSSISYIMAYPLAIILDGSILLKLIRRSGDALRLYKTKDNSLGEKEIIGSQATLYVESFVPLGSRGNHHMDMD